MAKLNVYDILRSKNKSFDEMAFDAMQIPPMHYFLSPQDVEYLHKLATSNRLSSKIREKSKMINDLMVARGFKRFSSGTNRVVYKYLENDTFLVKIALDKVGMQDNPLEYHNQFLLKPYVTKVFYVSPCGTVAFVERVLPIKNINEYKSIASDVFDMIVNKILGRYVMDDIGTKYFMNIGIRYGFGPVILDYPYCYKLDGNKLFCSEQLADGSICDGEIDYDAGFNHLICHKCGKVYLARNLQDDTVSNTIVIKGGTSMKIEVVKDGKVIARSGEADSFMTREPFKVPVKNNGLKIEVIGADGKVIKTEEESEDLEQKTPDVEEPAKEPEETKENETLVANEDKESTIELEVKNEESTEKVTITAPIIGAKADIDDAAKIANSVNTINERIEKVEEKTEELANTTNKIAKKINLDDYEEETSAPAPRRKVSSKSSSKKKSADDETVTKKTSNKKVSRSSK